MGLHTLSGILSRQSATILLLLLLLQNLYSAQIQACSSWRHKSVFHFYVYQVFTLLMLFYSVNVSYF